MKNFQMLFVEWQKGESATYYIDYDIYSKAHRKSKTEIIYDGYTGTFTFNELDRSVKVDTGVSIKPVVVEKWNLIDCFHVSEK